jgi:PASTA domain
MAMRRVHVAALGLSLVVLLAGKASAASTWPSWLGPQDLSPAGQDAFAPQVALDPAGNEVAVWALVDGGRYAVQAAARPAGGRWGAPQDLSAAGENADDPQVALNPGGDAVAVWRHWRDSSATVQAAVRPARGKWGVPQDLSVAGVVASGPDIALDSAGNAVAVWGRYNGNDFILQAAVRPAGGAWGAPQDLSAPGRDNGGPQVALDSAGNAVVLWTRYGNGSNGVVQESARPAGGEWGAPENLSAIDEDAGGPQIALDPAGNAIAVWLRREGINSVVQAAARPAGGAWGAPQDLSADGQDADVPQVALDQAGEAVAVWERLNGSNFIVQAAARSAGGAWGLPQNLSATGQHAYDPQIALDPAGNAAAVWWRSNGSNDIVQTAARPRGGAWGLPQDLSAAGGDARAPQVALGRAGNGVAVWWRLKDNHFTVQASITAPCTVPRIVGKTLIAAKRLITTSRCHTAKITRAFSNRVKKARAFSNRVKKGHVVRQQPKAGTRLGYRGRVTLVVSRGKRR